MLTLYERIPAEDLPFYLNLMAHLAASGVAVPSPEKDRTGSFFSILNGKPASLINLLFLRFDLQNIKTILRRLAQGIVEREPLPSILLIGTISSSLLTEIAKTGQLRSAIDLMATLRLPFAKPLLELRQFQPGAAIQQIELVLEKWYFDHAYTVLKENESLESFTANSVKMDADFTNLLVCLRLLHYPEERLRLGKQAISLMVRTGFIPLSLLEKVSYQSDIETAINLLADTPYGKCLQEGLRRYRQSRQLSAFEKQLKRYRLRWKAGLIARDPLGCGVPIGYLALKENEIFNLRQTALLTHLGFKGAEIMGQLEFLS